MNDYGINKIKKRRKKTPKKQVQNSYCRKISLVFGRHSTPPSWMGLAVITATMGRTRVFTVHVEVSLFGACCPRLNEMLLFDAWSAK